jgi:alpha-tubulin suppressor-like RCC1 family protein
MSSSSTEAPMLIGFGANYFQAMGPAKQVSLPHDSETNITAYKLENSDAPWGEQNDSLIQVASTASATMFLTSSGKIYMSGTLHGRVESPMTRTIIPLPLKCVEIACGRHFGLARMEGGLAVCSWGAGHFGQLGLGRDSAPCINNPSVIESLLPHVVGSPIKHVCAGYWHAMALTEAGEIFSWGCNRNSQCGMKPAKDPPTITVPQPVRFEHQSNAPKIVKLAAGRSHSLALDEGGSVYCWGSCNYGQCGPVGRRRGGTAPPKQVEALSQVQIVDIAAGDSHTLALTGGGRVFGWGGGFEGQLGIGSIIQLNPKPKLVSDLDFMAIEASKEYKAQQQSPQKTPPGGNDRLAEVPKVVSVHATGNCSFATSSSGHVYVWGCNDVGNLGIPKPDVSSLTYSEPGLPLPQGSPLRHCHTYSFDSSHNIALPKRIDCLQDMNITSVTASPTFVWCMGTKRTSEESAKMVGQTLYEVQESKRQQATKSPQTTTSKVPAVLPKKTKTEEALTDGEESPGYDGAPVVPETVDTKGNEDRTVNESFDEGSTSRHSMGGISSDNLSSQNLKALYNSAISPDASAKSLGNNSDRSADDLQSPKAKQTFSKTSFKKGVAKFARRATLGTFGNNKGLEELEERKSPPKMKRRSFFGN